MFVNNKGFSLAEILFCVAIVGLLVLSIANLERSAFLTQQMMRPKDDVPARLKLLQELREEIHRAERIEVIAPGRLLITVDRNRLEWKSERNHVQRVAETRQNWPLTGGIVFREYLPGRTVEIFLPGSNLHSYYSINGGIR